MKELWESGINVCFDQDSINDPWYPVGNGNLMNILDNGIHLAQTMSFEELDKCLDLITYNGARMLNMEDQYGIEEGKPANSLVLDASSPFEAVRQRAEVLASIRHGEYLFKRPDSSYEIAPDLFRKTKQCSRLCLLTGQHLATGAIAWDVTPFQRAVEIPRWIARWIRLSCLPCTEE